uniref:Uncharacterized protein n=1 Tax=Globodera rostochiensis TaxID=31243 RepID=A0A914I459_GLORO
MKGRVTARQQRACQSMTEQVVGRDGGRRKKSDERLWGGGKRAGTRGAGARARETPPSRGARGLLPEPRESCPTYWPP